MHIKKLEEKIKKGSYKGRKRGAEKNREKKETQIKECGKIGKLMLGDLSKRDLFIAGVALYWGEGSKGEKLQITNSDTRIVKFFIL